MRPDASPPVLKFGAFVVDLHAGELRKHTSRIRLQEKPLRVLALLAERQGQMVSRDELKKHLWPEDTFVDFETGLNTAVKKLRGALADDADNPRYIETIPRRGYRLIPPVEIVADNGTNGMSTAVEVVGISGADAHVADAFAVPSASTRALPESAARPATKPTRTWPMIVGAAALALVVFGFWWLTPLPDPKILKIFPVTRSGKMDFLVRPSTDGARIFYVQRSGDHYDLMQSPVDGGEAEKMEGPFPNTLIWDVAQDGSKYLITSLLRRGEPSQLGSWPVTGGPPVKLDDMVSGSAAWSPDGKSLAFHVGKELWIGSADGTSKKKLQTFSGDVDNPTWSPDGTRIRFAQIDVATDTSRIWEIRPDGSGAHMLDLGVGKSNSVCCGTWTPDGRYFVYVDTTESPSRLMATREKGDWLRRSPPGPFQLASGASSTWGPLVGRNGKHIYFYSTGMKGEMATLNVQSGQLSTFLPTLHPVMVGLSRDGKWAAFFRLTSGDLWRSRTDGTEQRELPFPGALIAFPRWSPDGKTIAFTGHPLGKAENAYTIAMEGGRPQPLIPGTDGFSDPDWSADGSQLVVGKNAAPAAGEKLGSALAIVNWGDRKLKEIPGSNGLGMPRWSPDGKWIAAVSNDRLELKLFEVESGKWSSAARGKSIGTSAWSADGAYLYFQQMMEPGEPLLRMKVSTGEVETVANFSKEIDGGVIRCVFTTLTASDEPIVGLDRGSADLYGAEVSLP